MLLKTSPGDTDRYELEQALSCLKPVLIELNHMAERLPKREVYLRFVPKTIDSAATMRVQELVQNLSGIDEETRKRLYHSVAEIIMGEVKHYHLALREISCVSSGNCFLQVFSSLT